MGGRIPLYDARLRRELAHRRLVGSILRRFFRVLSLHVLDAAFLAGAVLAVSLWGPFQSVRELTPSIVAVFLLSLNALSAYRPGDARRDRRRLLSAVVLGLLILGCLTLFPPHIPLGLGVLLAVGGLAFLALAVERKLADHAVRQAYAHGIGLRRAVVIGNLDEAGQALELLRDERNIDQYVVGHLLNSEEEPDPTALGTVAELPSVLEEMDVEEVILATTVPPEQFRSIADQCFELGARLYVFPSVVGTVDCRVEPLKVGACSLLYLHPPQLKLPGLFLKRLFDLVGASAALLLFAPVMALIALAIKINSPGPIFFRQQRVGVGGRLFTIYKFRSMYVDSEERKADLLHMNSYGDPRLFKLARDPRVTPVGRFLRRSSLDELPQLFNVLFGDMSLVGPRPPLPSEVQTYEPHHYVRLSVVPGITGPWQVGGRNLITDFETVVGLERAYIRSWSLLLDAKILLQTVKVVIRGEGAY